VNIFPRVMCVTTIRSFCYYGKDLSQILSKQKANSSTKTYDPQKWNMY